jgi:hypothetical protein
MSARRDSLDLIMELLWQGILPRNAKVRYLDYSVVKSKIKEQIGFKISANEIGQILSIFLEKVSDVLFQNPQLVTMSKDDVRQLISQNSDDVKLNAEKFIKNKFSGAEYKTLMNILIEAISIFDNKTDLRVTLLRTRTEWNEEAYVSRKSSLACLFNRDLTKDEFHLIARTWCYYAAFAQDLINPDNYTKEQIKELKKVLSINITNLKKKIKSQQQLIETLNTVERSIYIDSSEQESILKSEIQQLENANVLLTRLRQDNGSESNTHTIQRNAYFSLFFLGEVFALPQSHRGKKKNLYLDLIDILSGWSVLGFDKHATRRRITVIYGKYKRFKQQPEIESLTNQLIQMAQANIEPSKIIHQFETKALLLTIRPKMQLISLDA